MTNGSYNHHFKELCQRVNYNTVIFIKETGLVLALKDLRNLKRPLPMQASLSFNYDTLPKENSKVFYGLNLSLDNQTIICSGSVHVIDICGQHLVIVFYEPRIANFRDNQLPRIMWKDTESRYLGHSDYVPFENGINISCVGLKDSELYDEATWKEYEETDAAIFKNGTCFWDTIGKIKVNLFTTLVKLEKFPYYSIDNKRMGAILVYQSLNQVSPQEPSSAEVPVSVNQQMINRLLTAANIFIAVQNMDTDMKVETYSDNLTQLGYDLSLFSTGKMTMKDIVYPGDYDRYLQEVSERLYQKKETFSAIIRVVNSKQEIIPTKMFFTPQLSDEGKIIKVAILIDTYDIHEEESMKYEKMMHAINRMHTIFTVRKSSTPDSYQIVSENIHQFGIRSADLIIGKLNFKKLIHPDDLKMYEDAVQSVLSHQVLQTSCEYRFISKKEKTFWLNETMFLTLVGGIEYIESAIVNVTSSKVANESLSKIYAGENPEINFQKLKKEKYDFSTALKYSDVQGMVDKFSRSMGVDLLVLNNDGVPVVMLPNKQKTYETLLKQLVDFASFSINEIPDCMYENIFVRSFPITYAEHRIATLVVFALISDIVQWPGSRIFFDTGHLFQRISRSKINEISKTGQLAADSIGSVTMSAAITVLQVQSSASFAGDLNRQKKSHGIIVDLLNIGQRSDDLEQCFQEMMPKIGEAFNLTRGSVFSYSEAEDECNLICEWFVPGEADRKGVFKNLKKNSTFYADWDYEKNVSFVLNSDDLVTDRRHFRELVQAVVGVKLTNKNKLFGFINFVDNFQNRIWTPDEVMLFEDVGYILSSVIERSANRDAITHSMREYMRSMDQMPAAIALIDRETSTCQFANQKFWELVQLLRGNKSHTHDDLEVIVEQIMTSFNNTGSEKNVYFADLDKWYHIDQSDTSFEGGVISDLYILTDITQTVKSQETMSSLAFTDVLTGLPNRIKFEVDVKKMYENPSVDHSNAVAMLFNIDNFKMINNAFSYAVGDELLKAIAKQLKKISAISGCVYRFGGDEFAILVNYDYEAPVYDIATQVMTIFERPFFIDGYETSCTVSMGIVYLSDAEDGINDLIRKANISLKDAKLSGKNRFVIYDMSLKKYEEDTGLLERALKIAIDEGCEEFVVYFQPIVSAKTGKIVSAEVLVRWNSKEYGMVSPVKFIPIAESTGLIVPLGKFILNSACKEAKKWIDYGYDLKFSVNFSVMQTLQSDLVETIRSALATYRVPPKNLIFEVTESLAINDINKVIDILSTVRETGIHIAMDDFGTGYSSLNHLRRLPLDIVKIDRSFIFNIEYDPYTKAFVDTITKFCHMKETDVCCEGIETESQKAILSSLNVDTLQGYLFGKPVPADEFWKLLIKDHQ